MFHRHGSEGVETERVENGVEIGQAARQNEGATRRILGIGLAGFFLGMSDGIATGILPIFMSKIGAGAAALGLIEGCADAACRLVAGKGRAAGRSEKGGRKARMLLGALLASVQGFLAFILSPLQALPVRAASAVGRGLSGPIPEADLDIPRGTFRGDRSYRKGVWFGAIVGPALALASLRLLPIQAIFLFSFPLSFLAVASLAFFVRGSPESAASAAPFQSHAAPFPLFRPSHPFFASAGIFRLGNFAVTLLLLRAYEFLTRDHGSARAASLVLLLYIFYRILYVAAAALVVRRPARIAGKGLLNFGYFLIGIIYLGFIFLPPVKSYIGLLPALFLLFLLLALAGIGQSLVDSTERALMTELLPEPLWESGDRTLGRVRTIGALVSSAAVGVLWSVLSPTAGFLYAGLLSLLGAVFLLRLPEKKPVQE